MDFVNKIKEKASKGADWAGRFLSSGAHAQQDIPSQHRFLSAFGMLVGWLALDKIRDIVYGNNQISEGEFVELKREDVPAPLRFLHKTIDWNPHSDKPEDQWKKLAHQLMPAIGAGVGTVIGSMYAFERNEKAQKFANLSKHGSNNIFDAMFHAEYAQAKPLRVLTAFFGGFSAASMLNIVYGAMLNLAFASANGGRVFTGDLAKGGAGAFNSFTAQIKGMSAAASNLAKSGKFDDKTAKAFVEKVLSPMFGKDLTDPKAQAEVVAKLQPMLKEIFENPKYKEILKLTGPTKDKELNDAVLKDMKDLFSDKKVLTTFKRLGLNVDHIKMANNIGFSRGLNESLVKMGVRDPKVAANSWIDGVKQREATAGMAI